MVLSDAEAIGWKLFVTGWALMECLLFGGLHYGWGSLNYILKSEGVYADLCSRELSVNATLEITNGRCKPQDSRMALCFTIAATCYTAACVVFGHVNYKWGTRVTRIIAFLFFTTGSLMMAFISKENPWLMFPGLTCLAVGGLPLMVTNIQVSNLFVKSSSTVVGMLNGGYDTSSAVMLLVKIATENGVSMQSMFFIITALHSLVLVSTFLLLPKDFIKKRQPKFEPIALTENMEAVAKRRITEEVKAEMSDTSLPSLRSCVCNRMFLTHTMWLCLIQLRFFYFIGTLNPYLDRILNGNEEQVSYFTNVCYFTMLGGVVMSIVSGSVYDWQKVKLCDGKSERYRKVAPAVVPQGMTSLLSLIMSIMVLVPDPNLLYITFIVLTFKRSFLYSLAAAFIGEMFPEKYFGILYGIMVLTGGVFGFFQYALFTWAESYEGGPMHVDIFLLGMVCVSFLHPAYLWVSSWKEERKFKGN